MAVIPVLNASQAAEWDERARRIASVPSRVLMETAGRGIAQVMVRELGPRLADGVLIAAGAGNNGGDGWVVARALKAVGHRVWATEPAAGATGDPLRRSPDCEANRSLALADKVEVLSPTDTWPRAGVLVDALLGTGASGAPRGPLADLAKRVADYGASVVAVDGPTGLDLSTGAAHGPIKAQLTVTFGGARRGHLLARDWCGTVVVIDIGFPAPDAAWPLVADDRWASEQLPPLSPAMHKGDRGRVLVVGGAEGMAGAAMHAGRAAFGAGAGLVKLAMPEASVQAAQATLPDALTVTSQLGPEVEPDLAEALSWADAVIIGPGFGRDRARAPFLAALLERAERPVVLDADALHLGAEHLGSARTPRVLTPHEGEFRSAFPELADDLAADRYAAASRAAAASEAVVLLKGVPTIIASPLPNTPSLVVAAGNPALATGGSGDLLSGLIGAFLARRVAPQHAAALGALVLGRAAERAAAALTARATRPADIVAALPEVWRWLDQWTQPDAPVLLRLDPPAIV